MACDAILELGNMLIEVIKMYKEVFQLRLYAKRKELDISQNTVSTDTGIIQANISKYETGKLEPNLETLGKLADYYQVSTDWLIGNQYNGKDGNIAKAALNDFYNEAMESIKGAAYQTNNKEELLDMIFTNLAQDKEKLKIKYTIEGENNHE